MAQLRRGCSAGLLAALRGTFHPVMLSEVDWPTALLRMHTGAGDLSWDGETWKGRPDLVNWKFPEEAMALGETDGSVEVLGTLEEINAERLNRVQNRRFRTFFGVSTEANGNVLAHDPVPFMSGYMAGKQRSFGRDGDDKTHSLTVGLRFGRPARANAQIRHSAEDQAARHAGDTGGERLKNAEKRRVNPLIW